MATFSTMSRHLRAEDLPADEDTELTIRSYKKEDLRQDDQTVWKWVVYFHGRAEGLALNKSNGQILCDKFGDEMENWVGQTISLYVDPNIVFDGRRVSGIRIRS
jgi:hypothetical protein